MKTETLNCNEKPETFYVYKCITNNYGAAIVSENTIQMEKWKQLKDGTTIEFWKPVSTDINVAPILDNEIGKIYHGTDMILREPNKALYIQALTDSLRIKIEEHKQEIAKLERMKTCILNMF